MNTLKTTWLGCALVVLTATTALAQGRGRVDQSHGPGGAAQTAFPEQSPWLALPTSDDLNTCIPDGDPPPGRAVVECRVGAKGALERCDLSKVRDAHMKAVAACVLPKFQAKVLYAGKLVEVPMQFTDEPAK
jgi:hypothetical protein